MDLRLKTQVFPINGKSYVLRCNMNVLADVELMHNGNLMAALKSPGKLTVAKEFLAAMLNDYADEMGWEERWTPKSLGRELAPTPANLKHMTDIVQDLVVSAILSDEAEKEAGEEAGEGKNQPATQS